MQTIEAMRRNAITIECDRTIREAATSMDDAGVGALVVLDGGRLVGIVTDRDLVRRGLAKGLESDARVDGLMSSPVVTIDADADLHDAYAVFRNHAIRRLVVTRGADVVGMISVDDLIIDLSADLSDLARPVTGEVVFGHHDPAVPSVP